LVPRINQLLHINKMINFDMQMVGQSLTKLISPCLNPQDVRDALPECVINLLTYYAWPTRTKPPAWPIQGNERDLRQYEKALVKIESYCAMRLIY
jgi:hypothetical protein